MRTLTVLLVGLCVASVAVGDVALVDSFESYTLGSISGQGTWQAQANSSWTVSDHENSNVIMEGGDKVLSLVNANSSGDPDTVYTATTIPAITDKGTIYVKWQAAGVTDCLMVFNDLGAGWTDDGEGHVADGGQGFANYSDQAAMVVLRAEDQFRARNGGGYFNVDPVQSADTWYELWMQIDMAAQATRYYLCTEGGTPQAVLNNVGGEWWGNRNTTYSQFSNLKFLFGASPSAANVLIDDLGVDTSAWSLNAVPEPATMSLLALGGLALIRRRR